jgi:hypothetical protein
MAKKTVMVELSVPVRENNPRIGNIVMPKDCPAAVAELLGEGFGDARIKSGKEKFRLLRQCLLDIQVRTMARRFRFNDVTPRDAA